MGSRSPPTRTLPPDPSTCHVLSLILVTALPGNGPYGRQRPYLCQYPLSIRDPTTVVVSAWQNVSRFVLWPETIERRGRERYAHACLRGRSCLTLTVACNR